MSAGGADLQADRNENGGKGRVPAGLWVQFASAYDYSVRERELLSAIADSKGDDNVIVFIKDSRVYKLLPAEYRVKADAGLQERLGAVFGAENIKMR